MAAVLTQDPPSSPSRIPDILRRTVPWVRLMSILLFVTSALMILGGLVFGLGMATGMGAAGRDGGELAMIPGLVGGLFYAAVGSINLIPATFLMRFASRAKEYAAGQRAELLESALDAQRSYWKFMGMFAIICFGFAIIVIPIAAIAGFMAMRQLR